MTDADTDTGIDEESTLDMDMDELASTVVDHIDPGQTIGDKIVLSRRQLLAIAGGGLSLGALGTLGVSDAQAQSAVGTIGTASSPVDVEAAQVNANQLGTASSPVDVESNAIDNAATVTTQDLVVNGTATGPFGGGGVTLEAGDSITVRTIERNTDSETMETLYSGPAKDVLGGVQTANRTDFVYTFSDNSTIHKNGTGTSYNFTNGNTTRDTGDDSIEIDFLPPAKDVIKIEVGSDLFQQESAAEVILKD